MQENTVGSATLLVLGGEGGVGCYKKTGLPGAASQ